MGNKLKFLIKNVKLVPELSGGIDYSLADVLVNGKLIEAIEPAGSVSDSDYDVLDGNGMTLLPGLIQAHAHLSESDYPEHWTGDERTASVALDQLRYGQYLLNTGYTTIRDCGDHDKGLPCCQVRNHINGGFFAGPRIICGGPIIQPDMFGSSFTQASFMCRYANNPNEIRSACRTVLAEGADFIKLYGTGSMMVGKNPGAQIMLFDEMKAAVDVATVNQTYVAIHAHGDSAIGDAVRSGIRTIEHATFIKEENCKLLDNKTDQGVIPTMAVQWHRIQNWDQTPERQKRILEEHFESMKRIKGHNILVGHGTDTGMETIRILPGMEFKVRKEIVGWSNLELLKQATVNNAKLLMLEDQLGSVEVGKFADLILVKGDPLEDITIMYNVPEHVIKDGALIR